MSEELENISKINEIFIKEWISLNPNLKNIEFQNNSIISSNEVISLKSFIISDLLKNNYFNDNKYTISLKDFLFIVKLHVASNDILNTNIKDENIVDVNINEYVKNIKLSSDSKILIITNIKTHAIECNEFNKILMLYSNLTIKYNNYVPFKVLLNEFKKISYTTFYEDSEYNQSKYFILLHKKSDYTMNEMNYLKTISDFIFKLLCNEEYICSQARILLDNYNFEMNKLLNIATPSENEKFLLKLYQRNLNALNGYQQKIQEKEEASFKKASSFGFSSLFLIISSVLLSGFVLALFLILK